MKFKILTVLAGAQVGGAETFFVSLTGAFKRAGLSVHSVIRPNAARQEALAAAGIAFDTAPFRVFLDFSTKPILRRTAHAFGPDVLLAFAGRAASFVPEGDYAVVGRLGGYYNLKNFEPCDHLVCDAPDVLHHVRRRGWAQHQVSLIPNFPLIEEGDAVPRATLSTPERVPLALSLGRLHPNKAHDILIEAAARVPDLWVWIAGEGEERGKLQALARSLGVAERVKFLGWRTDRAGLFKAADLCVHPSRAEPLGNVVLEAWGYGVPLVTTASEGPAWLTRNGEDAIVTPVDDVPALAQGIVSVLSSKALAARIVAGGRRRIREEFSESAIVSRYISVFEMVLRSKSTR